MTSVLILGGGFGGLEVATRLRERLDDEHEITVVDERERFVVGAAKLWDIVGLRPLESSSGELAALDAKGIAFRRTTITAIDLPARSVSTGDGSLTADYLVVALGAAFLDRHVGMLQPPAFNLYDPGSVPRMREALATFHGGRIVVAILGVPYKCPPAPFEATFLIDQHLRERGIRDRTELEVVTVQPSPLPVAGPEASARVAKSLNERNVTLHADAKEPVVDAAAGEVRWAGGSLSFDLLFGVPQHVPPPVLVESAGGWLRPDASTLATEHERVYAVGDCTAIPNAVGEIPKAGVFAEAEGRIVADRIAAEIGGGDSPTFDGHGYCFLEFAQGKAAKVEGDFFASPRPDVTLQEPDEATFAEKEAFVTDRLARWL
jgi:sulfide:quinone oxidoreductase